MHFEKTLAADMDAAIRLLQTDPTAHHALFVQLQEWQEDPDNNAILQQVFSELGVTEAEVWGWYQPQHQEPATNPLAS